MSILDNLQSIYDRFYPPMYYTVSLFIPQGKVIQVGPTGIYPMVWHFHPWDFAEQGALLSLTHRMIDLHAWEPDQADIERTAMEWFEAQRRKPIEYYTGEQHEHP